MKRDIHPEYVETTRSTCTCGATFTTRSTAKNGVIHAEVCSQCHPFYTGKQKILDTGGRVARFEKRFGKAAGPTSQVATPVAGVGCRRPSGAPAPVAVLRSARRSVRSPSRGVTVLEALDELLARARATWSGSSPTRRCTPTRRGARTLGKRYAELTPVVETYRLLRELDGRPRARRRELAADDAVVPRRGAGAGGAARGARGAAAAAAAARATPTTTRTSSSRSRRARAARSRRCSPATCCGCTCATPSGSAGRPRSSTPPSPTSAATRTSRSR